MTLLSRIKQNRLASLFICLVFPIALLFNYATMLIRTVTTKPTSQMPAESPLSISWQLELSAHTSPIIDYIDSEISSTYTPMPCQILIAHGPDRHAGFATMIYLYTINFLLYANAHHRILWLDYNPKYNHWQYDPDYGPNPFEYYFQSINPQLCCNCTLTKDNFYVMRKKEIFPKMHYFANSSIHAWYYHWQRRKIKHRKSFYNESWFAKQRLIGSQMVTKYFHLKPEILIERDRIWNKMLFSKTKKNFIVLGVQMRGTDKGWRRIVKPKEYMPYIAKFLSYYGWRARIFIATDDREYLSLVKKYWTKYVRLYRAHLNQTFNNTVLLQNNVIRSQGKTPVFKFKHVSKYKIGKQVLLDILLLSKCDWFIHSASAVAEAVFYNNFELHEKSVHLEYTQGRQIPVWFK